ncbi:UDP-glucuronosyltransferase 2B19-like [Pomacea canaliculata]|uniref:UDP-glucuronosyltransferase 2B19-like n=1 Tax=Pomacea canaliculata TaxID=400727 RepID=UPI000D726AE3|nr:UDP-glucuronosyltransferase 2B19-like [Pomacea canaliculata]
MPYIPMTMLGAKAEVHLSVHDHFLDYPRPSLPNTKVIGGIAASPAKPLSADLQEFMDNAKDGVVIVSFGSLVLDLPEAAVSKLLSALESVPMKAVFRANRTSPDPGRILIMPWIPQNDLLAHRAKLQGLGDPRGASSQAQALYHAGAMLCIPLFYDSSTTPREFETERLRAEHWTCALRKCRALSAPNDFVEKLGLPRRHRRASHSSADQMGVRQNEGLLA